MKSIILIERLKGFKWFIDKKQLTLIDYQFQLEKLKEPFIFKNKSTQKLNRSEVVIAKFVDGYASGWSFAVKEVFKASLDIRKTQKMINKEAFEVTTQGNVFSFQRGDKFYNHRLGYDNWSEFVKNETAVCIQVESCASSGYYESDIIKTSSCEISKNNKESKQNALKIIQEKFDKGNIIFYIYKKKKDENSLYEFKKEELNLIEFIALLQNGKYFDKETNSFISLEFK